MPSETSRSVSACDSGKTLLPKGMRMLDDDEEMQVKRRL